ncbi:MAG: UDP-N-acetylglucosamine 4,6-dehydratase (inverting) [Candidatus Pacebacteria bacterium CG_4_10_14_0_8_um_filter_43_12]|nr:MAG: UDP-N-acetylglucosamine 4,6-dehydratase (inverting) [Candidatus Pacebacteria bacterium CG_4_10_14_0_8_um_filter_43_12]
MKDLNKAIFDNQTILVTGGTGSFGKAFIDYVLHTYKPESIRIYSRDELKQWQLKKRFSNSPYLNKLRFFLGDVRDKERLTRACYKTDVIIHAAALKQVPACENDPIEAVKTNIGGAVNVIDAALDNNVKKIVALSTDKASEPINLYGATKLCSDKLMIQANSYRGDKDAQFSVVRYGNVMGSRGSVIPLFLKQKEAGELTITDLEMTRFWITLPEAVQFVISSLGMMQGGELFIPKIPSMKIVNLAKAIAPKVKITVVGLRPGEKIHESLISSSESRFTSDLGDRYMLEPLYLPNWNQDFKYPSKKKKVVKNFSYTSHNNPDFLSIGQMRKILKQCRYNFGE